MGAAFCQVKITAASTTELRDKYDDVVSQAGYENGYSYSGSFSQKPSLEIIPGVWTEKDAREHAMSNDKWDPEAWAYDMGDGRFFVAGWSPS